MRDRKIGDAYFQSYLILSPENAINDFDPFNPDPVGALREAYVFISQGGQATHSIAEYNRLMMLMSRALARADGRLMAPLTPTGGKG